MTTKESPKHLPKALNMDELNALCAVPKNLRDQALIEIMAGCGLRVSEACGLTLESVHWSSETPSLRFPGKRHKERVVPMNYQVQDALRTWLEVRGTDRSEYIFCNLRTGRQLSRKTVWAALKRYAHKAGIRHVHPHMLRHTFGTALADRNVPVERIRVLMGHSSLQMSQIYITVSAEQKKAAVESIDRRPRLLRWLSRQRNRSYRFWGCSHRGVTLSQGQTVGRQAEFRQLQDNVRKGIDTLLVGPVGVGKSNLLALLRGEQIIRVQGLNPAKQAIISIAEELYQRGVLTISPEEEEEKDRAYGLPENGETPVPAGEAMASNKRRTQGVAIDTPATGPTPDPNFETFKKRHVRTSIQGWLQMVLVSVEIDEWVLVVDDLSGLTPAVGRIIARLNKKFVIVAAVHEVKKKDEKHFWKFEQVVLGNLPKADSRRLIRQCAVGADIEDIQLFETKVLEQSAGNPRAIIQSVDRLRKEPSITRNAVRDINHTGARPKLDLTWGIVLLVVPLIAARFIARGLGDTELYLVAGVSSAVAMGLRFFLYRLRK